MNILAIETSSSWGSVALAKESRIVYNSYLDIKVTHSERLLPMIDDALTSSGITLEELDLIALSNGPGSFTGIRIGLSAAKGLCMGAEIPLYYVNTLRLLAYNLYGSSLAVLPMIDARMGEIYASLYSADMQEIIAPCNSKPLDFLSQITENVVICGSGLMRYKSEIEASGIRYYPALLHQQTPQAQVLLSLALQEARNIKYNEEEIANLEPYYLRKSQAELNNEIKKKKEKK